MAYWINILNIIFHENRLAWWVGSRCGGSQTRGYCRCYSIQRVVLGTKICIQKANASKKKPYYSLRSRMNSSEALFAYFKCHHSSISWWNQELKEVKTLARSWIPTTQHTLLRRDTFWVPYFSLNSSTLSTWEIRKITAETSTYKDLNLNFCSKKL